jgi:hypothetical protein
MHIVVGPTLRAKGQSPKWESTFAALKISGGSPYQLFVFNTGIASCTFQWPRGSRQSANYQIELEGILEVESLKVERVSTNSIRGSIPLDPRRER